MATIHSILVAISTRRAIDRLGMAAIRSHLRVNRWTHPTTSVVPVLTRGANAPRWVARLVAHAVSYDSRAAECHTLSRTSDAGRASFTTCPKSVIISASGVGTPRSPRGMPNTRPRTDRAPGITHDSAEIIFYAAVWAADAPPAMVHQPTGKDDASRDESFRPSEMCVIFSPNSEAAPYVVAPAVARLARLHGHALGHVQIVGATAQNSIGELGMRHVPCRNESATPRISPMLRMTVLKDRRHLHAGVWRVFAPGVHPASALPHAITPGYTPSDPRRHYALLLGTLSPQPDAAPLPLTIGSHHD